MVGGEGEVAVLQEPGRLGGAEVRIEHQPGRGPHEGEVAGVREPAAEGRGAAVLPDDGPVQGAAGGAVEGDQRLALVGDADGGHGVAGGGQAGPDLGQGGPHGVPDLGRTVLDPAGPGEVLGELPVGDVAHLGLLVDHQGAHAGRARIDGDDLVHGGPTLMGTAPRGYRAPRAGRRGRLARQTIANGP